MKRKPFARPSIVRALALACAVAIGQMPLSIDAHAAAEEAGAHGQAAGSKPADPTTAASNPLSDAGTSGYHLYRRHCQSCHGHLGEGTEQVTGLTRTVYSRDHQSRRSFHQQFRYATRLHAGVARGTRNKPGPKFNDIELIGKFLREIEAWHAMLEQAEAAH